MKLTQKQTVVLCAFVTVGAFAYAGSQVMPFLALTNSPDPNKGKDPKSLMMQGSMGQPNAKVGAPAETNIALPTLSNDPFAEIRNAANVTVNDGATRKVETDTNQMVSGSAPSASATTSNMSIEPVQVPVEIGSMPRVTSATPAGSQSGTEPTHRTATFRAMVEGQNTLIYIEIDGNPAASYAPNTVLPNGWKLQEVTNQMVKITKNNTTISLPLGKEVKLP